MPGPMTIFILIVLFVFVFGLLVVGVRFYRKVEQGTAIVRTGIGGTQVSFGGMLVFPVVHRLELMDISVKRIEIYRHGSEGLICKDNIRADIKVAFFVRVNKDVEDVLKVAQQLGCERASQESALIELFDAKFSEALKTVGKQFDFVELYVEREKFRDEIIQQIGDDLNGYKLENAHIDYLEQTPKENLNPDNILDAEGIKKITDLTAAKRSSPTASSGTSRRRSASRTSKPAKRFSNSIGNRPRPKRPRHREIAAITARERAEAEKIQHEQKLKSRERPHRDRRGSRRPRRRTKIARSSSPQRNKERTDKVELERVERDRELEHTERDQARRGRRTSTRIRRSKTRRRRCKT